MRPRSRAATASSLASMKGFVRPGPATSTFRPMGTRSTAPHRLHQRPRQSRTSAVGAPWRAKTCRICMIPSSQGWARPSTVLVRTESVRPRSGSTGDEALEAAAVAEAVPLAGAAADDAEAVMALEGRMGIAPLPADHLAAAGDTQDAAPRRGIELREEAREVMGRADEPGGGRQR